VEWTGARYADNPIVEASTWIDADPARVWSLVSDIELMPTLSNELMAVKWVNGYQQARVGASFVGHNEHPAFGQWHSTSQIVVCDAPREFAWAVGDSGNPSATWRFRLTPRDGGIVLTFGMRMGSGSCACGSSRPRSTRRWRQSSDWPDTACADADHWCRALPSEPWSLCPPWKASNTDLCTWTTVSRSMWRRPARLMGRR
jgi:uncharacterized protein YndB with AHSA1/START domain